MATVDAAAVKKLREMTSAGIMDCKTALAQNDGDFEKAAQFLREKGIASAAKKADRAASEGAIGVYISEDGKRGALVEVNCETDFVARNDNFRAIVKELAEVAANNNAGDVASLNTQSVSGGKTVEDHIKESIGTLGENIVLARVTPLETSGLLGSYVHSDGKQAAIVEIAATSVSDAEALKTAARDVAMQSVALRAPYLNRDEVPASVVESEKEIYRKQASEEGKPEAMLEKIAEGRLNKFYSQETLLEQAFVKDTTGKQTVAQYVKSVAASAGEGVNVARVVRYKVGEGAQ
jgi:elongation factor Ts